VPRTRGPEYIVRGELEGILVPPQFRELSDAAAAIVRVLDGFLEAWLPTDCSGDDESVDDETTRSVELAPAEEWTEDDSLLLDILAGFAELQVGGADWLFRLTREDALLELSLAAHGINRKDVIREHAPSCDACDLAEPGEFAHEVAATQVDVIQLPIANWLAWLENGWMAYRAIDLQAERAGDKDDTAAEDEEIRLRTFETLVIPNRRLHRYFDFGREFAEDWRSRFDELREEWPQRAPETYLLWLARHGDNGPPLTWRGRVATGIKPPFFVSGGINSPPALWQGNR
jgi:hypothetical protein